MMVLLRLRPEAAASRVCCSSFVVFAAWSEGPPSGLPMPGKVREEALRAAAGRAGDCRRRGLGDRDATAPVASATGKACTGQPARTLPQAAGALGGVDSSDICKRMKHRLQLFDDRALEFVVSGAATAAKAAGAGWILGTRTGRGKRRGRSSKARATTTTTTTSQGRLVVLAPRAVAGPAAVFPPPPSSCRKR
jgi:hypothetical protein